jgi:hypothetical protein
MFFVARKQASAPGGGDSTTSQNGSEQDPGSRVKGFALGEATATFATARAQTSSFVRAGSGAVALVLALARARALALGLESGRGAEAAGGEGLEKRPQADRQPTRATIDARDPTRMSMHRRAKRECDLGKYAQSCDQRMNGHSV